MVRGVAATEGGLVGAGAGAGVGDGVGGGAVVGVGREGSVGDGAGDGVGRDTRVGVGRCGAVAVGVAGRTVGSAVAVTRTSDSSVVVGRGVLDGWRARKTKYPIPVPAARPKTRSTTAQRQPRTVRTARFCIFSLLAPLQLLITASVVCPQTVWSIRVLHLRQQGVRDCRGRPVRARRVRVVLDLVDASNGAFGSVVNGFARTRPPRGNRPLLSGTRRSTTACESQSEGTGKPIARASRRVQLPIDRSMLGSIRSPGCDNAVGAPKDSSRSMTRRA